MRRDLSVITDGTAQDGRLAASLHDHFFDVDDRSLEELVAYSAEVSKFIHYYDSTNRVAGSWKTLFDADEVAILADIITTDTARMEEQYLRQGEDGIESALYLVDFARHIDHWYRRLNALDDDCAETTSRQIEAVIANRLRESLNQVLTILHGPLRPNAHTARVSVQMNYAFHPVWNLSATGSTEPTIAPPDLSSALKMSFYSMVSAVAYLKPIAMERMRYSLIHGNHSPGAGLLIACERLIEAAQERINLFSSRHRDFYYRDVLKMRPKPQVLDTVFLLLQPNLNAPPLMISQGTQFTAGKLDGQGEIIYETTRPLLLTNCCIQRLLTMHCSRQPSKSPESELGYIDGIHFAELPALVEIAPGANSSVSWPIFGGTPTGGRMGGETDAAIGFAVASTALRLSEGNRTISLRITLRDDQSSAGRSTSFAGQFRSLLFGYQSFNNLIDGFVQQLDAARIQVKTPPDESYDLERSKRWFQWQPKSDDETDLPSGDAIQSFVRQIDRFRQQLLDLRSSLIKRIPDLSEQILEFDGQVQILLRSFSAKKSPCKDAVSALSEQLKSFLEQTNSAAAIIQEYLKSVETASAKKTERAVAHAGQAKADPAKDPTRGSSQKDSEVDTRALLMQDPDYVFHVVLQNAFVVSVTGEKGWYQFPVYSVSAPSSGSAGRYKLTISMSLGADSPAIVAHNRVLHGANFADDLPVLRLLLNPQADVYGYSLFDGLVVEEIESEVSDASRIVAWNQFGQLDPSKPFAPFGPMPTTNSYLVVGHYESAGMNLTQLAMRIEWGDLPTGAGGFAELYKAYGPEYTNDAFLARVGVLRDARWRPLPEEPPVITRLFDGRPKGVVEDSRTISIDVLQWFKPIDPSVTPDKFRYDQRARGGFFRLELAAPEQSFGHREYPYLLTSAVSGNARRKMLHADPGTLPATPYTPTINRISFCYKAKSSIQAGSTQAQGAYADTFYSVGPFGVERVNVLRAWGLFPRIDYDGNLLIGFTGTEAAASVTLLFHLREDSATKIAANRGNVTWWYLGSNEWRPVSESRVLSDTTNGFLTSGIIVLELPPDIDRSNTIMPSDCYWIRASLKEEESPCYCSMYWIQMQAVPAVRRITSAAPNVLKDPLPPWSVKGPMTSIRGLKAVVQPIASFGGKQQESHKALITRTAERLRHKGRAVAAWDYERLVLEAFPEVYKVKCFAAMSSKNWDTPHPGSVLVVVIPQQPVNNGIPVFDPLLDANRLTSIEEFLKKRASPQVCIEVRNPNYERILVRCSVSFKDPMGQGDVSGELSQGRGYLLRQLNQSLVDYLSPWVKTGLPPRFGWKFQLDEVQAYIRSLPYVRAVAGFSMLRLSRSDDGFYELTDTVRAQPEQAGVAVKSERRAGMQLITPRFPWSLAIPNGINILMPLEGTIDQEPRQAGIGELGIGNIFTVRGDWHDASGSEDT